MRSCLGNPDGQAGSERHHAAPKLILQSARGFEPRAVAGRDQLDPKRAQVFCCRLDALVRCPKEMQPSDHGENAAIAD